MKNSEFNLTEKESQFVEMYLNTCGNGYSKFSDLLDDNYSCHDMETLQLSFPDLSAQQIGGFLSSLIEKGVLSFDDRSNDRRFDKSMLDLYWLAGQYIEFRAEQENDDQDPEDLDINQAREYWEVRSIIDYIDESFINGQKAQALKIFMSLDANGQNYTLLAFMSKNDNASMSHSREIVKHLIETIKELK